MKTRSLASILAFALACSCATGALAEATSATYSPSASPAIEAAMEVQSSVAGGQVLDTQDAYYIAISELPGCENGTVLVYDKAVGTLSQFAIASNISQMVYLNDAIYALTPVPNGVSLIRITDKCEVLTTAPVIDQLTTYDGRLYFLADSKLSSIMPDGSDLKTHAESDVGQYAIVDGTVYFTNMSDAKTYSVNSLLEGSEPLSLSAGCLYSLSLASGVQVKLLSDGVKSIKALGDEIYLQNMGESYVVTIGGTEQPAGRLCRFDPSTRKLERLDVQGEYGYFPTDYGLVVHTDYDLALYASSTYSMSLYKPESGASVYPAGSSGLMVYEPVVQRLTYVSLDLNQDNFVVYSGSALPEQTYTRPTLSPMSSERPTSSPSAASEATAEPTPHPTYKPAATRNPTPTAMPGIIFQDSDTRRLTENEIRALKTSQMIYARYEILARNGYVFNDTEYLEYYRQFDWYREDPSFQFGDLDTIESYNYELIRAIMNEIFATPKPTPVPTPKVTPGPEYDDCFIFPDSSRRKLTREEVLAIDPDDLLQARYEILARNGYVFDTKSWQRYYEEQEWYSPDYSFEFGDMTELESYNYELMRDIDNELDATPAPTQAPEVEYEFIFPEAMERMLTREEVLAVPQSELLKARYEILARCGYVFDTQSWQDYFEQFSWYIPDPSFEFGDMDTLESYNYELIRAIDEELTSAAEEYEFIFPDALTRKLTREEVLAVPQSELLKARYEILARCGYVFEDTEWLVYFQQYSWYVTDDSFLFGDMNEVQSYNYELIRDIDEELSGDNAASGEYEFIFPDALTRKLTREEVLKVPQSELLKARYEILARCGYVFEDTEWLVYFQQYSWYVTDDCFLFGDMNEVQSYNYELIRDVDEELSAALSEYDFVFPDALTRKLTQEEVLAVPQSELLKARYEILARCGYVFDTQSWQDYFEQYEWYVPNSDFAFGDMNELESYNYELIRSLDD